MTDEMGNDRPFPTPVRARRRYLWCTCGRSKRQPMCDGTHAGSSLLPFFYTAEETGEVNFCGCKQTSTPPLCDGKQACARSGTAASCRATSTSAGK
jgi:CDGSH-type Zn-finger protein